MGKRFFLLIYLCLPLFLGAQSSSLTTQLDSIFLADPEAREQSISRTISLAKTAFKQSQNNTLKVLESYAKLLEPQNIHPKFKAEVLKLIGTTHVSSRNFSKAIRYLEKEKKIRILLSDPQKLGHTYNNLGLAYTYSSMYKEGLENHQKALKIKESTKDLKGIASSYHNIGLIYDYQQRYTKALYYYEKSLKIKRKFNDKVIIANSLMNIGGIFISRERDLLTGIKKLKEAEMLYAQIQDSVSICLSKITQIEANLLLNKIETSDSLLEQCKSINNNTNNRAISAYIYLLEAKILKEKKQYNLAIENFINSSEILKQIGAYEDLKEVYKSIYTLHEKQERYKTALLYLNKLKNLEDSLEKSQNQIAISVSQEMFESEQREKEIQQANEEIKASKQRQNIMLIFAALLAFSILILILSIRQRIKNNRVLRSKNKIITEQKKDLEQTQNNLLNSIEYAKTIQKSFLSSAIKLRNFHADHFIFQKPRDIVSGDFYWFTRVDELSIFSVIDCTGHGVPGALMSMLANRFLNEIIVEQKNTTPNKILEQLHLKIVKALKQEDKAKSQDGMDLFIASFDSKTRTLQYAGARNKAYLILKGDQEITQLKTTQKSIGGKHKFEKDFSRKFELNSMNLKEQALLYMFTDGYADQFGGEFKKKFGTKKLREMLFAMKDQTLANQGQTIAQEFQNWKQDNKQTDDCTLIGIKL